jgi:hypothetical protein
MTLPLVGLSWKRARVGSRSHTRRRPVRCSFVCAERCAAVMAAAGATAGGELAGGQPAAAAQTRHACHRVVQGVRVTI